ncbi:hypothetical protein BQ8420_14720 [Nocardiopsis sp. JB363]|nr:hypothetical protein BQ8420_14720 [Nocardiopsis sp. JB363]
MWSVATSQTAAIQRLAELAKVETTLSLSFLTRSAAASSLSRVWMPDSEALGVSGQ